MAAPKQANTVLVTGGCGFVGRYTVRELLRAGHRVVVIDDLTIGTSTAIPPYVRLYRDSLSSVEQIKKCLIEEGVSTIVHLVGRHSLPESMQDPLLYYKINEITTHLLEACHEVQVNKLVFASTSLVYNHSSTIPLSETACLEPLSPYGRSKLGAEWRI